MIERQMILDEYRRQKQAEFLTNPSVKQEDEERVLKQVEAIRKRLEKGPIWTGELRKMAAQYNARLNEIRTALADIGLTVDLTEKGEGGNNKYEIVEFEGSEYQKHLQEEGRI